MILGTQIRPYYNLLIYVIDCSNKFIISFKLMSAQPTNLAFKYPECKKGEFHVGESLSLVCIQPKCLEKCVICGICYNEEHKDHHIRPLKIVINKAKKYLSDLSPMNIDMNQIKTLIDKNKKAIMDKFDKFDLYIKEKVGIIKDSINAVFIKIGEQIDLKCGNNEELIKALDQIREQEIQSEKFINLMQKLLAGVPLDLEKQPQEINSKQIEKLVGQMTNRIEKDLTKKADLVVKQLDTFTSSLQKTLESSSLFDSKIEFKFSQQLKHTGIQVISDTIVKSIEAYNYHFGLMEPSIAEKGIKSIEVAFKIKENVSSWLAVGLCHKSTVQTNNFQFNYSSLGHGGYLASCNGGSWSSIDANKNNVVTSFNYTKNDIIVVSYNADENNVIFTKKETGETHTLEIDSNHTDELYLCSLFYYNNDEIQYLGYTDEI